MMTHGRNIAVIGLGYVGLPVAVAFARLDKTIGFDIDEHRISELEAGVDVTGEVPPSDLENDGLVLTNCTDDIAEADFYIVTVPTPIDNGNRPDLVPLISASKTVGSFLKRGDVVVFESTVYPGATEELCLPILEALSGLRFGKDFTLGYSPERINPGDKVHRLETLTKVVSGSDTKTLDIVAKVYESVVTAGVHRAPDIKTAEAAKVIENTQRDLNIALMNELAFIFDRLDIDTRDVLEAASTKWNFLSFKPGLVGGHCIGVDPYYLTHRAEQVGYHPQLILAGRRINDSAATFVVHETVKRMAKNGGMDGIVRVAVMGLTFKPDVPDLRNTKVISVVRELEEFGIEVLIHDPLADPLSALHEHGLELSKLDDIEGVDGVIIAVAHESYVKAGWGLVMGLLKNGNGTVSDVQGVLDRNYIPKGVDFWRL